MSCLYGIIFVHVLERKITVNFSESPKSVGVGVGGWEGPLFRTKS